MADGVRQEELDRHNQRRAHSISCTREAGDPTRESASVRSGGAGRSAIRNVGGDFSQGAPENSSNCDQAEAAVHREDFARRGCYPSRILIAFSLLSITILL